MCVTVCRAAAAETKAWEVDTLRGHTNNVSCVMFHARQVSQHLPQQPLHSGGCRGAGRQAFSCGCQTTVAQSV